MTEEATVPKNCGLATASLVCGILSLVGCCLFSGIPAVICGHKAMGKIKRSNQTLTGEGLALAGLITGYIGIAFTVMVLPMLLAIAIPSFVNARSKAIEAACRNNLRMIESAKDQYALDHTNQYPRMLSDLVGADGYIKKMPVCQAGGTYSLNGSNEPPTCSIGGKHALRLTAQPVREAE